MIDILHAPGFLGTNANFAADMTLVLSLVVAFLFTYGAWIAKQAQRLEKENDKGRGRIYHTAAGYEKMVSR